MKLQINAEQYHCGRQTKAGDMLVAESLVSQAQGPFVLVRLDETEPREMHILFQAFYRLWKSHTFRVILVCSPVMRAHVEGDLKVLEKEDCVSLYDYLDDLPALDYAERIEVNNRFTGRLYFGKRQAFVRNSASALQEALTAILQGEGDACNQH